jgi:hypothetical protein
MAAAVGHPSFGLRAKLKLFLLAVRAPAAASLKPRYAHAIAGSYGPDAFACDIDYADWLMPQNNG